MIFQLKRYSAKTDLRWTILGGVSSAFIYSLFVVAFLLFGSRASADGKDDTMQLLVDPTPRPKISSITPNHAPMGASVVVSGENFSTNAAENIVYIGGVKATVSDAQTNALTIIVPSGASYAPITVFVNGAVARSYHINVLT